MKKETYKKSAKYFVPLALFSILGILALVRYAIVRNCYQKPYTEDITVSACDFQGSGTRNDPFIISGSQDLEQLRTLVNRGESFDGCYFLQTENIDLNNIPTDPIGTVDSPFGGIYNGGGHSISNLRIESDKEYAGFFGTISGTVANLGIESGEIGAVSAGGIVGRSVGFNAAILNCYSKVNVHADRAAGLADFFPGGVMASCIFCGNLEGEYTSLVTTSCDVKLFHCRMVDDDFLITGSVTKFLLGFRLSSAVSEVYYANERGIKLNSWQIKNGNPAFADRGFFNSFVTFVNLYFLPIVLLLMMFLLYRHKRKNYGKYQEANPSERNAIIEGEKKISYGLSVISGVVSLFVDCALIGKGISCLNPGNLCFILLINLLFCWQLTESIQYIDFHKILSGIRSEGLPLAVCISIVSAIELAQFNRVPRFDSYLYYGSMTKAINMFQLDFLSYLGDFVCWKCLHGLVLIIAPFEFLAPGKMIGMYLANIIITAVTMVVLYRVLRTIAVGISPFFAAVTSMLLMLFPYEAGIVTYLCIDTHITLFLIWLIYSYQKKNHLLVCFCGYLLAFSKITGLVFYVVFLLCAGLMEGYRMKNGNFMQRLLRWWNWHTVLLWMAPAVFFLPFLFAPIKIASQAFFGSSTMSPFGQKTAISLLNTVFQSYLFGFRWVIILIVAVALVLALIRRKKLTEAFTVEGLNLFCQVTVACFAVFVMLMVFRGDAECPRYTALFNTFYVLAIPFSVFLLSEQNRIRNILLLSITIIMSVQLVWTIDPSIIFLCDSLYSGKKSIYKLALPNDPRLGMALGTNYGNGYEVYGDLYVYNLEYGFQDDLLDKLLDDINPNEHSTLVILDVIDYEYHINGTDMHYPIYWNTREHHRTFDGNDADSIYFSDVVSVTTDDILSENSELKDRFYLLVPPRIDSRKAISALEKQGYKCFYEKHPENVYGSISVFGFEKSGKVNVNDGK